MHGTRTSKSPYTFTLIWCVWEWSCRSWNALAVELHVITFSRGENGVFVFVVLKFLMLSRQLRCDAINWHTRKIIIYGYIWDKLKISKQADCWLLVVARWTTQTDFFYCGLHLQKLDRLRQMLHCDAQNIHAHNSLYDWIFLLSSGSWSGVVVNFLLIPVRRHHIPQIQDARTLSKITSPHATQRSPNSPHV